MAVFSISFDIARYPVLQERALELSLQATSGDLLDLDGRPCSDKWLPLALEWLADDQDPINGLPDLVLWRAGQYACSENAMKRLSPLLGTDCEFLPLTVGNDIWYAIHVLKTIDAIDHQRTELNYRPGGKISLTKRFKKLVLNPDAFSDVAICHVNGAGLATFCSEHFVSAVAEHKLKGLLFKECII